MRLWKCSSIQSVGIAGYDVMYNILVGFVFTSDFEKSFFHADGDIHNARQKYSSV